MLVNIDILLQMLPRSARACRNKVRQQAVWRYVPTMKHFQLFLLFFVGAVSAVAASAQLAPEQRRAELRLALKAPRSPELSGPEQSLEKAPASRYLSEQERTDLRQQLRQQRRDLKERSDRP